jgi:hypothetical protein
VLGLNTWQVCGRRLHPPPALHQCTGLLEYPGPWQLVCGSCDGGCWAYGHQLPACSWCGLAEGNWAAYHAIRLRTHGLLLINVVAPTMSIQFRLTSTPRVWLPSESRWVPLSTPQPSSHTPIPPFPFQMLLLPRIPVLPRQSRRQQYLQRHMMHPLKLPPCGANRRESICSLA